MGHKGTDITYDLYAGEADWDNNVELMELVKYPREAARCSRSRGKNIISNQIIYVGNWELAMYNSHTPKNNKDY